MANLIAYADAALTGAATWASVDSTALLSTNSGAGTTLTTSDQDSTAFAPGAITIDAIALKLSQVAATPAHDGTLTVTLRNSTDAVDAVSLSYNIAELVANGDAAKGGWYLFKLDASYLLHAVDSYIIRLKVSATAGKPAVAFMTNGTAANWQHLLRTTTAATAAASDDLFILGELAAAATWTTRTVTMDSEANTDYGANAVESEYSPSLVIGKNGVLTWGTTGSKTYILKLSGSVVIFPGGIMNMGTTGTPCPRTSSMDLQLDTASTKQYRVYVYAGSAARGTLNLQGLSRTTGKNVDKCKLNADLAVSGTTCNVDTDTGWLVGDEVVIAPTDRTYSHDEPKVLTTGDAGASSFTVAAVSYVHSGVAPTYADIILLTRNVRVRALNTTYPGIIYANGTMDWDWARVTDMQINIGTGAVGALNCDYCSQDGAPTTYAVTCTASTEGDWHFRNFVQHLGTGPQGFYVPALSTTNWELATVTIIGGAYGFNLVDVGTTVALTNLLAIGSAADGITVADAATDFGANPSVWTAYCNGTDGMKINATAAGGGSIRGKSFTTFTAWGNVAYGIQLQGGSGAGMFSRCIFDTFKCYGNGGAGLRYYAMFLECQALNWDFAGLTTSSMNQPIGITRNQGSFNSIVELVYYGCTFGVAAGVYATHATGDIVETTYGTTYTEMIRYTMRNCKLGSATEYDAHTNVADGSFLRMQRHDQTDLTHKTVFFGRGTVAYEVTTYKTSAPSIKMTPASATKKLNSGVMHFAVTDGVSTTVQVQVRKDATYNGNAPRLVAKRNDAIGLTADTVLASLTAAADTWELLTGVAIASPIDNGVVETYVDCDGTAGNVYVDEWSRG